MKKLIGFTVILLIGVVSVNAQISEGKVVMEMSEVSSSDPQIAQMAEMMKGTTSTIYFQGEKSLMSMNMMGGMIDMKVLSHPDGSSDMLMNMMGQKMHIPITKAEQDRAKAEAGESQPDFDIESFPTDTKTIAGFNCHKIALKPKEGDNISITAYVTKEIKTSANVMQNIDMKKLEGFPLEYSINTNGMTMTFTAKSVDNKVDAKVFEINTSGYTKMSLEEFTKMTGGMGAGFGF